MIEEISPRFALIHLDTLFVLFSRESHFSCSDSNTMGVVCQLPFAPRSSKPVRLRCDFVRASPFTLPESLGRFRCAHFGGGGEDGGNRFDVASAAADDAGERFLDVGLGRGQVFVEQFLGGKNQAGRAVPPKMNSIMPR